MMKLPCLMRRCVREDADWVAGDWKSFDRTCMEAEIRCAPRILRGCLSMGDPLTLARGFVEVCFIHTISVLRGWASWTCAFQT